MKLKVETNCREHFTVSGFTKIPFKAGSAWFNGATYKLEELLGTKLRALYQRRKGRDLFDLHKASHQNIDTDRLIECYLKYIRFSTDAIPTQQQFLDNMEAKMRDDDFLGDIISLIRPAENYDTEKAYTLVLSNLLEKI